jgi:hypothetical protein
LNPLANFDFSRSDFCAVSTIRAPRPRKNRVNDLPAASFEADDQLVGGGRHAALPLRAIRILNGMTRLQIGDFSF